jgi:transcriptional regulator with XRE-family HTH domain
MTSAVRRGARINADEGSEWLKMRMAQLGITGLDELHQRSGIDKGSISRYFRQERIPGVDVIAPLCKALEVSPETLLVALGAIEKRFR